VFAPTDDAFAPKLPHGTISDSCKTIPQLARITNFSRRIWQIYKRLRKLDFFVHVAPGGIAVTLNFTDGFGVLKNATVVLLISRADNVGLFTSLLIQFFDGLAIATKTLTSTKFSNGSLAATLR
jgi:uncharacterized surface protein with fasciclin (FAS1) repeats